MLTSNLVFRFALLLFASGMSNLLAQPTPVPGTEDLRLLFSIADAACVGTVTSISQEPGIKRIPEFGAPMMSKLAIVDARRCYKPADFKSGSVRVRFYEPADSRVLAVSRPPGCYFTQGEYALLLLKRSGEAFECVNDFGKLPMSPLLSDGNANSGIQLLEQDLQAGIENGSPQQIENDLTLLGAMGHVSSTVRMRHLAGDPDPGIRDAALLALLRVRDYSHMEEALQFMQASALPSNLAAVQRDMSGAFERVNDRELVPILLRYSDSPNQLVRGSVVRALRQLDDMRSVPALVRRLDDPVFFIRYDAVFTLATIEGRLNAEWSPGLPEYKEHEAKYLQKWRNWWLSEGQSQFPDTHTTENRGQEPR